KRRPYLVLDGYRGLREALGPTSTQQLLSGLTSQMPFYDASVIVTAESDPHDPENFAEVTSADTLIALFHTHLEARTIRTLEVMKVRGKSYLRGLHGFDITSDGIVVYPRLSACLPATAPAPTARRYSFDLPEFDAMLGGGLPEFSSTMIMGDTGTGKSTLALQYIMAGAEQGERGLILALHDERVDVLQKAADLQIDLATHVESGRVEILEITPVEIDPYALAWRIREVVERHRPQRFVIDSVSDLEAAPGVQQSPRDYLFALNLYLRRAGVTTVMTYESGSMNQFDTPGQSLVRMPSAQNRILLQRVIRGDRFYRTCSVVHMQRSDHDTRIREFVIGPGGMTFRQLDDEGEDIAAEIA
ncbi:MAG TPA: ATPase domain-containing protein, partial [Chloroflexota bacterium]